MSTAVELLVSPAGRASCTIAEVIAKPSFAEVAEAGRRPRTVDQGGLHRGAARYPERFCRMGRVVLQDDPPKLFRPDLAIFRSDGAHFPEHWGHVRAVSPICSGLSGRIGHATATERRLARERRNLDDLRRLLEQSRTTVGVEPEELMRVAGTALARMGAPLPRTGIGDVQGVTLFKLDPADPAFAGGTWAEAFDDLRVRRRERRERLKDYRAAAPLRAVAFRPAILPNGADVADVVQLHLEHRLIRRLLTRFTSQGFQTSLSRCCVVAGPGAQPRVLLLGRLALYGPGASRLHEEIVTVTAIWSEAAHGKQPLRPLGTRGEETTMAQLDMALRDPRMVAAPVRARLGQAAAGDAADLAPELEARAAARRTEVEADLVARGEAEATSLQRLLQDQRARIADAASVPEDRQMSLPGIVDKELAQLRADRRHWDTRLRSLDAEIATEPARVREAYRVRAARVEPVGLVYLWPVTN